jgi:26S proteasome regulatory subunit N3
MITLYFLLFLISFIRVRLFCCIFFQFCRYLFYLGKIRTIQLEYTDAKESLLQAARKAPVAARGFRIQCNKWAIIVRLLLGEIPERTVFMQKGMEKALRPYFELTNVSLYYDANLS